MNTVMTVLAFLVFGFFWLASRDWFDLLPARLTRGLGVTAMIVLIVTVYLAPSAFKAGLTRFVQHRTAEIQDQLKDLIPKIMPGPPRVEPTPASRSTPARR